MNENLSSAAAEFVRTVRTNLTRVDIPVQEIPAVDVTCMQFAKVAN